MQKPETLSRATLDLVLLVMRQEWAHTRPSPYREKLAAALGELEAVRAAAANVDCWGKWFQRVSEPASFDRILHDGGLADLHVEMYLHRGRMEPGSVDFSERARSGECPECKAPHGAACVFKWLPGCGRLTSIGPDQVVCHARRLDATEEETL